MRLDLPAFCAPTTQTSLPSSRSVSSCSERMLTPMPLCADTRCTPLARFKPRSLARLRTKLVTRARVHCVGSKSTLVPTSNTSTDSFATYGDITSTASTGNDPSKSMRSTRSNTTAPPGPTLDSLSPTTRPKSNDGIKISAASFLTLP